MSDQGYQQQKAQGVPMAKRVFVPPVPPPPAAARPPTSTLGERMLIPVDRSGWAIAAGYLGLVSLTVVPGPIALIVSVIAIVDLRKRRRIHGWGRAIFGLLMGLAATGVMAWFVMAWFVLA